MPEEATEHQPKLGEEGLPAQGEELLKVKTELLDEIKKQDDLRKEILKSLRIKNRWKDFFQQPAVLLVVGFLLTSVMGAFLTSFWQEKDKRKQDARLIKELNLKNKTEIMNATYTLILQTYAASSDMIAVFQRGEMPDIRQRVLLERMEYWQKTSREWREKYPLLDKNIVRHFRDEQIHEDFLKVVFLRGQLGVEIPNWRSAIFKRGWRLIDERCNEKKCAPKCERKDCPTTDCEKPDKEKYFFNRVRCTNIHNEDMKEKALAIIDRMMVEINADEHNSLQAGEGLFARLKRWVM